MKHFISFFVSLFVFNVAYAAPSVSVVAPNGGQCYTPGSTVPISWSGMEYDHVAVAYRAESEGAPPTYTTNPSAWNIMHPASGSSYNWLTPTSIGTGIPYKMWIEAHSPSHGYLAVDSSDYAFGFATSCTASGGGTLPAPGTISGPSTGSTGTYALFSAILYPDPNGSQVQAVFDWGDGTTYTFSSLITPAMAGSSSPTVSHAWSAAGTYAVRVKAKNSTGLESGWSSSFFTITIGGSSNLSDTTSPANPTAPFIDTSSAITSSSMKLGWTAPGDDGTAGTVSGYEIRHSTTPLGIMMLEQWWMQAMSVSSFTFDPTTFVSSGGTQKATISGLSAGTTYYFAVKARDEVPNWSTPSGVISGITLASSTTASTTADTTAPVISGVQAVNIMGSGAQITWTTDDLSDSRVFYGTASGSLSSLAENRCYAGGNVTAHCVNLTGLAYSTVYYYKVESRNAVLLNASSAQSQFTSATTSATTATAPSTDTTSPTAPYPVSAYAQSSSSISVSWSGATDNIGVAGYKIFRSGSHRGTTTGLSYTDTGLNSSTNYVYTIAAYDAAGNFSGLSPSASATTMSAVTTTANNGVVSGKVTDAKGVGLAGVFVNANHYAAGVSAQTKTGSDGAFTLVVASGDWGVSAYSEPLLGYYYQQGQKTVSVSSGQTVEVNFTMLVADAQITGSIVNQNGQILADASGYISTYVSATTTTSAGSSMTTMALPAFGGSIEKGNFNFRVPAGTYALTIYFSPDSKYSTPASQSVSVASGAARKADFIIAQGDATIAGLLRDASGAPVTGIDASKIKLYVSSGGGAWRNASVDTAAGTYSVSVAPGAWYLGAWVDPSSGYAAQGSDVEATVAAGEKRMIDITLTKASSFIAGTTKTADGAALANAWISIGQKSLASSFVAGGNSDNLGNFKIAVPAGTYFVRAYYSSTGGSVNPTEATITVDAGKTATADLVFRKPDTKLTGATTINGKGVPAFVRAWSESGGSASVRSDANGAYSLNITRRDRWHVASFFEQNGAFSASADVVVETADQASVAQDLVLLSGAPLAQATERAVEVAKPQSVEVSDGAKIIMPANALGISGTANVSMKPTAEVPSFASLSVVGTGYQVDAKDDAGTSITNLNAEITITIPYDDADLLGKGLTPESLSLSFFDETANVWKSLEKQIVDKQTKTISAVVNHLTLFALVAPADTAPPQAPFGVSASFAGTAVTLAWKNPSSDFHHVKIYRSSQAGTLGEVVFNYVTNETKTDSAGTASHYYVVRAVDLAGNESANTAQVNAVSTPSAAQVTATAVPAPSGVLLVYVAGDPRVYVVKDGKRSWIRSPEEFARDGYDWKAIVAISAAQLAAYPDATAPAASSASYSFTRNLSSGARGEAVRKLQALLAQDKNIYPQGKVSGYFGPATRAAVIRFQKKYGIVPASGLVGLKTRQKLNELQSSSR